MFSPLPILFWLNELIVIVFLTSVLLFLLCLNSFQHGDKLIWQSQVVLWSLGGINLEATKSVGISFAFRVEVEFALFSKFPFEGKCLMAIWLPTPLPSSRASLRLSLTGWGMSMKAELCLSAYSPCPSHRKIPPFPRIYQLGVQKVSLFRNKAVYSCPSEPFQYRHSASFKVSCMDLLGMFSAFELDWGPLLWINTAASPWLHGCLHCGRISRWPKAIIFMHPTHLMVPTEASGKAFCILYVKCCHKCCGLNICLQNSHDEAVTSHMLIIWRRGFGGKSGLGEVMRVEPMMESVRLWEEKEKQHPHSFVM